jgi:hypothetical protein
VYSQVANFPGGTVASSQNDIGGLGTYTIAYDNFSLGQDTAITDLHWHGGYFNGAGPVPIASFTISFFDNAADQPGATLLSQTIAGNAGETFVGNDFFGPVFDYAVDLSTPFGATAGTTYWLTIIAALPVPPNWGWYTSAGGDGTSVFEFFGNRDPLPFDFAFDLTGTAVPEPGSCILVGIGLAGIRVIKYRRRVQQSN